MTGKRGTKGYTFHDRIIIPLHPLSDPFDKKRGEVLCVDTRGEPKKEGKVFSVRKSCAFRMKRQETTGTPQDMPCPLSCFLQESSNILSPQELQGECNSYYICETQRRDPEFIIVETRNTRFLSHKLRDLSEQTLEKVTSMHTHLKFILSLSRLLCV